MILSFFGSDLGTYSLWGLNLEHEGFGYGMVFGTLLLKPRLGRWFLPLAVVGVILIVSEPLFVDALSNPLGTLLSVLLGFLFVRLVALLAKGGRRR